MSSRLQRGMTSAALVLVRSSWKRYFRIFDAIAVNPLLTARRDPGKDIRWRYPERFPYRVIYEVLEEEQTVVVAAVLHAVRHDQHWQKPFLVEQWHEARKKLKTKEYLD